MKLSRSFRHARPRANKQGKLAKAVGCRFNGQLRPNQDLKSRITYSAKIEALTAADLTTYIHTQLERGGLPHTTFTEAATNLI